MLSGLSALFLDAILRKQDWYQPIENGADSCSTCQFHSRWANSPTPMSVAPDPSVWELLAL